MITCTFQQKSIGDILREVETFSPLKKNKTDRVYITKLVGIYSFLEGKMNFFKGNLHSYYRISLN